MLEIAKKFKDIFEGDSETYGIYYCNIKMIPGIKNKGTARTRTPNNYPSDHKVTTKIWLRHLLGEKLDESSPESREYDKQLLGITPINAKCLVKFGAIDIDSYDGFDHEQLIKDIEDLKLPLVVCRSKSGGAHCYCFTSEPIPAEVMIGKLKEWASVLGHARGADGREVEIFPKQTQVFHEKGDYGQWINMPYNNAKHPDSYAIGPGNKKLSPEEFITLAEEKKISLSKIQSLVVLTVEEEFSGFPPCLIALIKKGAIPDGSRNNALYNVGVALKMKDGDNWEQLLEEFNYKYMDPPLSSDAVQGIIKSLRKKSYYYQCEQQPLSGFCDKNKCKLAKYGIGKDYELPEIKQITKLNNTPPVWYVEVEINDQTYRLETTTEEIQDARRFQKVCMETANVMPKIMKRDEWQELMAPLIEKCHIIEAPPDASNESLLLNYLESFCNSKAKARTREELLLGKPWTDENGDTHFQMQYFFEYLNRKQFKEFKVHQIGTILKSQDTIEHKSVNIKGSCRQVYVLKGEPKEEIQLDLPKDLEDEKPIY